MRARKTVITAAACAMALLPAASAVAGSGPAPAPDKQRKAPSTAPSAAGNPMSARAQAAGVCADAYVIGSRGLIGRNGDTIGSVKQFYSPNCNENYGYVWVWQSFVNTHDDYDVSVGVFSYDRDHVLGERTWYNSDGQEYWSDPAYTVSECTSGVGSIRAEGDPLPSGAWSSKRC